MANEDRDALDALEKEAKEFDKDTEIDRIIKAFSLNPYAVLDLQPGVPDSDIKATYRKKSLLIHPDKTSNPRAPDAFDRLKKAQSSLMDEKERKRLDECISDARQMLMREKKLTADDEETKGEEFAKEWRFKTVQVIIEEKKRRDRQLRVQMQEEGREQAKADAEIAERKRKREHEQNWEKTRDDRIGNWRDFQKGTAAKETSKKKKKLKVIG